MNFLSWLQGMSRNFAVILIPVICILALTGCGDESATSSDTSTVTYTLGGSVSGLTGTGLVLQNNSGDDITINADGGFTFATGLTDGATFTVTISSQPTSYPGQICSVSNGSGTMNGGDVTSVLVLCATGSRTIG
jgi:hypothetical protein